MHKTVLNVFCCLLFVVLEEVGTLVDIKVC